jgi:hypothetical protein
MGVLSDASELASDISARIGYIIPPTPDLIGNTGFYPIREAAPGVHVHRGALRVVDAVHQSISSLAARSSFPPARCHPPGGRPLAGQLIKAGGADRCRPRNPNCRMTLGTGGCATSRTGHGHSTR